MAIESDVADMAKIDSECFGEQAKNRTWFSRRLVTEESVTFAYVAKLSTTQKTIGYMIAEYQGDCVQLIRIAVLPMYRRAGHGRHLVAMLSVDKPLEVHMFHSTVPETDLNTQLFYKGIGWTCIGIKKNAFRKLGVDGFKFQFEPRSGKPCL
jgi:ribosomal protein S18 acetylase RimI-like enzyme